MTASAQPGPLSVTGTNPPVSGPTTATGGGAALVSESNPDLGPSLFWAGTGIRDPDYPARIGAGANIAGSYSNQDVGWYMATGGLVVCDQAPSTASTTNLAAGQVAASGTALTLAVASTGVTVLAAPLTILPTGNVVPAGCLVLDGNPAWTAASFAFMNPTTGISRAIAVTAAGGATGGAILLTGYDYRGNKMTQTVTSAAGTTVNSLKAFKFLQSAVPQFSDGAHDYSIGTADVFGLAIRADEFAYVNAFWNSVLALTAAFTAAVTTSPATALTGDVRGTVAPVSGSDGVKKLVAFVAPSIQNVASTSWSTVKQGLLGVQQA
jgi:hypothetical protein